jgi:bifunctional UDP-N-acetylglucosamine pyrophosphorylase/glucosamine-1-phosphate N-acetyltransferase
MKRKLKKNQLDDVACVVLAGGEGTRMKSEIPKVLHKIYGKSLIEHVLASLKRLGITNIVTVVGYKSESVSKSISRFSRFAIQKKRLGTADALKEGLKKLPKFKGRILVLCGDTPLITGKTLKSLIDTSKKSDADCTLLTATLKNPTGYGRILRDDEGNVTKIIEEKDASLYEKVIEEINTGIYCFKSEKISNQIKEIKPNNAKKEYYLTDIIEIFSSENLKIESYETPDTEEILGINSRFQLVKAHQVMKKRIINKIIASGVTIIDPESVHIDADVSIGQDTIIEPFVRIENNVIIGRKCHLGPFLRIRPNSIIKDNVRLGNFVEVVRSKIDSHTKANHLAYIGDSQIGKKVNVGAGAVTANYNGKEKNKTVIGDGCFIGSGSILVAPLDIGKDSVTGANSLVTKGKVKSGSVVIGVPAKEMKKKKKQKTKKAGA